MSQTRKNKFEKKVAEMERRNYAVVDYVPSAKLALMQHRQTGGFVSVANYDVYLGNERFTEETKAITK